MKNSSSRTVRLLSFVMVAIALVFGGCSFWDQFVHPRQGICVEVCVALGKYVKVHNVDDVLNALKKLSPDGSLYRITVRTNADGTGDKTYGHLTTKCCSDKRTPAPTNLYSVTVTQNYKYSAGTASEAALKDLAKALGQSR